MTHSTTEHRFIEPHDVLFLRGNKLFGDAGSHGESLVPPWPSAAAGALRSQILVHDGVDLSAFASGNVTHPTLGTPHAPGSFTVTAFTLAQRHADGHVYSLHPLPADLVITEENDQIGIQALKPHAPAPGLLSSCAFAQMPVLAESARRKAATGFWLTVAGWQDYLNGRLPTTETGLIHIKDLWGTDHRVGIGLNAATRSADDGKLFTAQAVAFKPGVGFLASVTGAPLPLHGTLRLGGDGRAAQSQSVAPQWPMPDLPRISTAQRCRLVLTTPGLFAQGSLPNGFTRQNDSSYGLDLHGVRARLVCATVPRAETVSGWDLARWQPKAALRAAPAGSVYWLDQLAATPEALGKLAESGLWSARCEDPQRRAEGFNRLTFAAY
jgi:CRISPR-associated protein Cmr3